MAGKDVETISNERLTRFYLLNHFLLRKTGSRNLVYVGGTICGLHSQLPQTPFFSLWNRVRDFEPEMLDDALYRNRSLVKTWFMRGTLHIVPSKDMPVYHSALKRMWFEHHGRYMNAPGWPSLKERQELLYPKIVEALVREPLRRKELNDRVRSLLGDKSQPYARLFSAWGGILKETSYMGLTIYAQPCGKEACFARVDKWLPRIDLNEINEEEAREKLLLKYLHCYGPASAQDFACWSGLLTSEASKAIETSTEDLGEVQVQDSGKSLWMLKKAFKILEEIDLEETAPLCLLPKFDSYLLGHKDRARIIDEEFLKQVCRSVAGDIAATVLINGRVTGTWIHNKTNKRLTINVRLFKKLDKESLKELEQVAKDLGTVMKIGETRVRLNNKAD